jgi:regulation of enolase protein 1 (concanavalin A-like superfamily)
MTGHFARQLVTGDRTLTARLVSRAGALAADRIGLLMAKSLSPFDQAAGAILSGGTTPQLMLRTQVAGRSAFTGSAAAPALPLWLRLTRTGTTFAAAVSGDGQSWTPLAEGTIPNFGEAPYYAGLVVCSRDQATLTTVVFDEVSVVE